MLDRGQHKKSFSRQEHIIILGRLAAKAMLHPEGIPDTYSEIQRRNGSPRPSIMAPGPAVLFS